MSRSSERSKSHVPDKFVDGQLANRRQTARDAIATARSADERFFTCVENMLDCFGIFAAIRDSSNGISDFRIDYLNAAACANSHTSSNDELGHYLCELLPSHRTNGLLDTYCRVVETGTAETIESFEFNVQIDGKTVRRWFDIRAFKLGDGFAASWRDVSRRHIDELALRERDDRLQLALAAGNVGIWEWQVSSQEIYWSPEAARHTTGVACEHFGRLEDFTSLVHPDDREELWRKVDRALNGVEDYRHEFRVVTPDGRTRWVSNAAIVIRDEAGNPIRVVGTVGDITERRLALDAHRARENHLHAAKAELRQLAESIPNLVWGADADGRGNYVGPQWTAYVGAGTQEQAGEGWIQYVHPEDVAALREGWERAVKSGHPFDAKYRLRRHDGVYRWFHARGERVLDSFGTVLRWWGTSSDIHEQVLALQAASDARVAAEYANSAKDHFLSSLSHELRSPLTPVITLTHLLLEEPALPRETRNMLMIIDRNIALQVRLIDDLLDLTRIQSGKLLIQRSAMDAHDHIRHALSIVDGDLHHKSLHLNLQLESPNCCIIVDAARFEQIIWNLLKNAVKFTPDGGTLTIRTFLQDDRFTVSISDTGIGIEAGVLPTIFDSFQQGGHEITRRFGGLGLGLAISKRLVELMDGTIKAESAGRWCGATFSISFAIAQGSPAQILAEKSPNSNRHSGLRVLLVDDHNDARFALARLLSADGLRVREADCIASALRIADAEHFDLVISDIGLPDGSGWDLMHQLSSKHRLPGIALSGFGMPDDVRKSRDAGFAEHLTKPVSPNELRHAIDKLAQVSAKPLN